MKLRLGYIFPRVFILGTVLWLSFFTIPLTQAAITEELTFYGTLQNSSGVNLDGTYDMVLRFYNAASGGSLLDTSTHTTANGNPVTVSNGEFSVRLGSGAGNTLDGLDFDNAPIYIGLSVEGDPEMTPRELLTSAAYSFNADRVDGYDANQLLRYNATGSITATDGDTLFTITQNGVGDILNIFDGGSEVLTVIDGGNFGVGTTSPTRTFSVSGDAVITGALYDNSNSAGTNGMVLQSTGSGFAWVATSTLGLGGSNPFGASIDESELNITGSPTDGYLLQASSTAVGGFTWVATSTLGISGGAGGSLFTDGSTTTYLTATGDNLSIGGTSATAKLSVSGNINLASASAGIHQLDTPIITSNLADFNYTFGHLAGQYLTAATDQNVAIGYAAGQNASTTFMDQSVYIGHEAGRYESGGNSTLIGYQAGQFTSGSLNTVTGWRAGRNNTGNESVFIGSQAGEDGSYDYATFIGTGAGDASALYTGEYNIALGYAAFQVAQGDHNIAAGYTSANNLAGSNNIALGQDAGIQINGDNNIAIGEDAGGNSIALGPDGDDNIFLGRTSGYFNEGSDSIFIGRASGYSMNATNSTAVGTQALARSSLVGSPVSSNSVALGYRAGYESSADNNIFVGFQAADNSVTGTNNIVVGYDVDLPSPAGNNQLNIGNLLFGTNIDGTGTATSSGNIGIGTSTPSTKLMVSGVITPSINNAFSLGNSTYRWSEVFATNGVINTSDERLKENIAVLDYGLEEILALEPVSFTWIDNPGQGTKLGFIAQDVQKILPEIISVGNDTEQTLGIRYTEMFSVVVKAIHELWETVTGNTKRIAELEARLHALENDLENAPAASPEFNEKSNNTETDIEANNSLPEETVAGTSTEPLTEKASNSETDEANEEETDATGGLEILTDNNNDENTETKTVIDIDEELTSEPVSESTEVVTESYEDTAISEALETEVVNEI